MENKRYFKGIDKNNILGYDNIYVTDMTEGGWIGSSNERVYYITDIDKENLTNPHKFKEMTYEEVFMDKL